MIGRPRSSLDRALPKRRTDAAVIEAMRRRAWLEQGIVTLRPVEIHDEWERQVVINMAVAKWGRRPT